MLPPPPRSTRFPYTTLFRSAGRQLLGKADLALSSVHHALVDFDIPGFYIKPKEHRENSQSIQTDGFAAYSCALAWQLTGDRKSTRLNSSHLVISYAVFCLKK